MLVKLCILVPNGAKFRTDSQFQDWWSPDYVTKYLLARANEDKQVQAAWVQMGYPGDLVSIIADPFTVDRHRNHANLVRGVVPLKLWLEQAGDLHG